MLTEQNNGLKAQVSDLESQLKKSKAELKEAELETGSYKRLVAQFEEENSNPKSKGSAAA